MGTGWEAAVDGSDCVDPSDEAPWVPVVVVPAQPVTFTLNWARRPCGAGIAEPAMPAITSGWGQPVMRRRTVMSMDVPGRK